MECVEKVTESGVGLWGDHPVVFALSTLTRTWRSRIAREKLTRDLYRLTFRLDERYHDRRDFQTEAERRDFVDQSLSDVRLGTNVPNGFLLGLRPPLAGLNGKLLVDVNFWDYGFELKFGDEDRVTFEVWPTVRLGRRDLTIGENGYREALLSFAGQRVRGSDVFLDDGVVLIFRTGELQVRPDQIRSAEYPELADGIWAQMPPFD